MKGAGFKQHEISKSEIIQINGFSSKALDSATSSMLSTACNSASPNVGSKRQKTSPVREEI